MIGLIFLSYYTFCFVGMVILLILWIKEKRLLYKDDSKGYNKLLEQYKILWIIGIGFGFIIIPIAFLRETYFYIKKLIMKVLND